MTYNTGNRMLGSSLLFLFMFLCLLLVSSSRLSRKAAVKLQTHVVIVGSEITGNTGSVISRLISSFLSPFPCHLLHTSSSPPSSSILLCFACLEILVCLCSITWLLDQRHSLHSLPGALPPKHLLH